MCLVSGTRWAQTRYPYKSSTGKEDVRLPDLSGLGVDWCDNLPAMVSRSTGVARFDWRIVLAALALFAGISLCQADLSLLLRLFVVAVLFVSSIVLLICVTISKHRRQYLRLLPTLAILWTLSIAFFVLAIWYPIAIRTTVRWLVGSHDYEAKVLAQPASPSGELKHIEWDGWGFPGAGDTTVYLVFDPTDSLSGAARSNLPGRFDGIPCEVPHVSRLDSHWYTVEFYTDERWGNCK